MLAAKPFLALLQAKKGGVFAFVNRGLQPGGTLLPCMLAAAKK
jgi:hypothetical protein